MKLTNIYEELLNEDFKSQTKKFVAQGFDSEIVKSYIDKFKHIRDKKYKELFDVDVKVDVPSEKRNDIDSYNNFHDLEIVVDYVGGKRPVSSSFSNPTNDIDVSGEAVYRDDNVEVFYADNPRACIKYKGNFSYSWCIARSDSSNMFYTYRFKPYEPAFYFIKDIQATKEEFKFWNLGKTIFNGQFKNKYHFFVLQVPKNINPKDLDTKQYIVSSAQNEGDIQMSWNEILAINPNLNPIHEVLQPKPFSEKEKKQHERFKNGINDIEFKKLSYEEKRDYLDIYPTIGKPITNNQLMQLPDDLLNLYVSFGIGLDDEGFSFIKNKPAIFKRYAQISKRKFDEFMKDDKRNRNRNQLTPVYTEIIVLPDEDIKTFLGSLTGKGVNKFIATNGIDKLELLEKHFSNNAVSEEFKFYRDLLFRINEGDEEALVEIKARLPQEIGFDVYSGFVTLNFVDFPNGLDDLDSSITYFLEQSTNPLYWVDDDYDFFNGWEEGLEEQIIRYLESILAKDKEFLNQVKSVGIVTKTTAGEAANELYSYIKENDDLNEIENIVTEEYNKKSSKAKEKKADDVCDKIKYIIEYRQYDDDIIVKLDAFILFIRGDKFFTTVHDDFISNVNSMMEDVLEIYDLPNTDQEMRDNIDDNDIVTDDISIEKEIVNIIIKNIEESLYNEEDEESEESEDIIKRRQQLVISYLSDTLENMKQDPYASMIENDIVRIDIDRKKFKINGQVYVKISDKQNGKFHEGYIFIKDLPTYFTNYKLFEQVNKIKKIINYEKLN